MVSKIQGVLKNVLERVTPSSEVKAETEEVVKEVMQEARLVLEPRKVRPILAGSFTRDTWMPDKKEFEVFMLFPVGVPREELEKQGLELGKKIVGHLKGSYIVAYAEHPYIRARIKGFMVDIVPCYGVKSAEKIQSAVDRTPFHNRYVSRKLNKRLSPEVRLLKRLCKGLGVYGSDTRTQGFSGYLCELLIIRYGGFLKLLKAVKDWEPGVVIDLEGYHKRIPERLRERFREQPLVVIDPVDRNRNVAAALSPRNLLKFISSCSRLLKSPSINHFFPKRKRVTAADLKKELGKRQSTLMVLRFKKPDVIDDILWPQLRRFSRRLRDIMEENDFHVIGYDIWSDREFTKGICLVLMEMETWKLPAVRKTIGPPIFSKKHSQQFLKKYKSGRAWVENERWVAEVKRESRSADSLVKASLKGGEKTLRERGVPSYIARSAAKGFSILKGKEAIRLARSREIAQFLNNYFHKEL